MESRGNHATRTLMRTCSQHRSFARQDLNPNVSDTYIHPPRLYQATSFCGCQIQLAATSYRLASVLIEIPLTNFDFPTSWPLRTMVFPRRMITIARILSLLLFVENTVAPKPDPWSICSANVFGTPDPNDCAQAIFWIPYINAPASASPDAKKFRLFSEPRLQDPPFKAVIESQLYAPLGIEQLPKIFKHGT